jgi:hypothetical protein
MDREIPTRSDGTPIHIHFEVLDHPAYSPDLAPSDYNLFGPLKDALRDRRFTSDEEVEEVVHEWLTEGIQKLC